MFEMLRSGAACASFVERRCLHAGGQPWSVKKRKKKKQGEAPDAEQLPGLVGTGKLRALLAAVAWLAFREELSLLALDAANAFAINPTPAWTCSTPAPEQ